MRKDLKTGILIGAAVVTAAAVMISFRPENSAGDKSIQPQTTLAPPAQQRQVTPATTPAPVQPKPEVEKQTPPPAEKPTPPAPRFHVVTDGQTLSAIALLYYGDPAMRKKIYDANRHIIDDIDKIRPAMKLNIPR
jgi:nucleoid-associated protein YgaU